MQVLFAHLVYGDCSKIKMIIFWFPTYVRGDFDGLKSTGFLAESHLFAFNTLRLVYSMEKNTNNWLHHSFVANDASFSTLPFRTLSYLVYRCLQQILLLFYQPSVELELWKRFHVFKKVRNISRFDWDSHECVTIICLYTHSEKLKPIDHVLLKFAYCPVNKDAVTVRRSDWPRAKWDHPYCKPMTGHFMTNPGASD